MKWKNPLFNKKKSILSLRACLESRGEKRKARENERYVQVYSERIRPTIFDLSRDSRQALTVLLLMGSGCLLGDEGLDPPLDAFYYPTSIAISEGKTNLYVVNSDFDLKYNGGTVQTLDLPSIRLKAHLFSESVSSGLDANTSCSGIGLGLNSDSIVSPGICSPLELPPLIKNVSIIGAFASDSVLGYNPEGVGARLFVTVRGDPSVTYFDLSDDRNSDYLNSSCGGNSFCLDCGSVNDRCSSSHRIGENPNESTRSLVLPVEPVGIAISQKTDALIVANQTDSAASLIRNDWNTKPSLEYFLSGLGSGPTELASIPIPEYISQTGEDILYQQGFALTFRFSSELDVLKFYDDGGASPSRPFLEKSSATGIRTNSSGGWDSRGIVVDDSNRKQCEKNCDSTDDIISCLKECVAIPLDVYIANRTPASLVIGKIETKLVEEENELGETVTTSASETLSFTNTIALSYGPSQVAIGTIIDNNGDLQKRIFAVTFDSKIVYGFDPQSQSIDFEIQTGRGPHAIAFDSGEDEYGKYSHLYVGHFTDSFLGIVDLDMRNQITFSKIMLHVGVPNSQIESDK